MQPEEVQGVAVGMWSMADNIELDLSEEDGDVDFSMSEPRLAKDANVSGRPNMSQAEQELQQLSLGKDHDSRRAEAAAAVPYDAEWLKSECVRVQKQNEHLRSFSASQLAEQITSILSSSSVSIEEKLIELLGFDCLDFVSELVIYRTAISLAWTDGSAAGKAKGPRRMQEGLVQSSRVQSVAMARPRHVPDQRTARDVAPSRREASAAGISTEDNAKALVEELGVHASLRSLVASSLETVAYPHEYEEFILPFPERTETGQDARVKIATLPELVRKAFQGYVALNAMQSIVYPTAFGSNENMLVCAPTGAGKTDVAMLAILKSLQDFLVPGSDLQFRRDAFKIIYVAPMKALAAEISGKFARRLGPLKIVVRECTGDMQLSKKELRETQILVTTPEKWDVITRKSMGDEDLVQRVALLIIDEVHLLNEGRGPVLESIVARTLREVEISQRMIRIVGLSATLPNYADVASFLRVNPYHGLFFFGDAFRPVPLRQHFVGVKGKGVGALVGGVDQVCFDRTVSFVKEGHQVMIFVHSRNDTVKTAKKMVRMAGDAGLKGIFAPQESSHRDLVTRQLQKVKSREIKELFQVGFSCHHAGMLRADRSMVERLFEEGHVKVLVCTATLAWGVNLPAHAVIIKGTQVYDSTKGEFVRLGILDVLQIFGRAGRPQYESHGEGIIITAHANLAHYLTALTSQIPIESQFSSYLPDNLNAEIALGTVANIEEAITWLGYTYLYVRMKKNPLAYGLCAKDLSGDPSLRTFLRTRIMSAAQKLRACGVISIDDGDEGLGTMRIRDVGRIASLFYLKYTTIELFARLLHPRINEEDILDIISQATEFENIKVREEELSELENMASLTVLRVKQDLATIPGKVSLLIQAHISRRPIDTFSLVSDLNYVEQNASRVLRALFEILRNQNWALAASRCLAFSISFERRVWQMEHPLAQFGRLPREIVNQLDLNKASIQRLGEMSQEKLVTLARSVHNADLIRHAVQQFPRLEMKGSLHPISKNVLQVVLEVRPLFTWNVHLHGHLEIFWIWIEDPTNATYMYHCEYMAVGERHVGVARKLSFYVPLPEPLPTQLLLKAVSDRWLHAGTMLALPFAHLVVPTESDARHTELLPLKPLPISALHNDILESLYRPSFGHFNPIQTQAFHSLYHTDMPIFLSAPTGSGKTVLAELAIWRVFQKQPGKKIVYVAPLNALAKERADDWSRRLEVLGMRAIELVGDTAADLHAIRQADLIVTTPERWSSATSSRQSTLYSQDVVLMILDEIHLLGRDRGPAIEMLVARMRLMADRSDFKTRIVGLSTALANAEDMASWLGVPDAGLFNFRSSVRPVPLEVRIEGFAGLYYSSRMATMNKAVYSAILGHSPAKPVLVFVSSRRQARLTAQSLIAHCANDDQPRRFLHMTDDELSTSLCRISDSSLRFALGFGIALYHVGLAENDRLAVEELFVAGKAQVMIATSALAWSVVSAHLVILKGTECYAAKAKGYADVPLTDVLQMIGRAGRPQLDKAAKACVFVHDIKKNFYKKFLYEPFSVESSLHEQLADHLTAEISAGTVKDVASAVGFLQGTFLERRLEHNPSYYTVDMEARACRNAYLSQLAKSATLELSRSNVVAMPLQDNSPITLTLFGRIASRRRLCHLTIRTFLASLGPSDTLISLLKILACAHEFSEDPLRHNEDVELAERWRALGAPFEIRPAAFDSPNTKALVLLYAFLKDSKGPTGDCAADTRAMLEQAARVGLALIEVTLGLGYSNTALSAIRLLQCIRAGRWLAEKESTLLMLPNMTEEMVKVLRDKNVASLASLLRMSVHELQTTLNSLPDQSIRTSKDTMEYLKGLPFISLHWSIADKRVAANSECILKVSLHNQHPARPSSKDTPKAPGAERSWFLLLALPLANRIMAFAKLAQSCVDHGSATTDLAFYSPPETGTYNTRLYLLSGDAIGIDQEFDIEIVVE